MHSIERRNDYLYVSMRGEMSAAEVHAAVLSAVARDDYFYLNTIYELEMKSVTLGLADLRSLRDKITAAYPAGALRNKTALVSSNELICIVGEIWADVAKDLPYEVQVFQTLEEAEAWISPKVSARLLA